MGEFGHRPAERAVDLHLAEGVVEMVVAADHMGDAHVVIVDDDREIVGRGAVRAQNDQIVELAVRDRDLALHRSRIVVAPSLRRLEADRRRHPGRRFGRVAVAPGAVIARPSASRPRARSRIASSSCRRAIAVIGAAGGEQLPRDLGVTRGAGELVDDLAVPLEAEPVAARRRSPATASGVERSRSVSSMRSRKACRRGGARTAN